MSWFGADPGGKNNFGVAHLQEDGRFETKCVSCTDEAVTWFKNLNVEPRGIGIDCPMWWSSAGSSDRLADKKIRKKFRLKSGTVQTANSLRGAVLIQGQLLAFHLRAHFPKLLITEAHPKALLNVLGIKNEPNRIQELFGLRGVTSSDHERDAVIAAVAVREGATGKWTGELSHDREPSEQDPTQMWFGPVRYYWPEAI